MKRLILFALLVPMFAAAQDIKEYKATNGVTYHLNDTVRLGRGSNNNGSFVYIEDRGAMGFIDMPKLPDPRAARSNGRGLQKEFANGGLIIKSIKKIQDKNVDKYVFMVSGAGPFRLNMFIDDAISTCEVTPCKSSAPDAPASAAPVASVADEIKKLKELMDSGAITKEEFEKRKAKLLNQ